VNDANEEFGLETIKKMLTSHRDSTPQEIIESVLFEIKQFAGKRNQHDDITMMIIQSEAIK
jgi:serine phosphatase RsbU (regulator of sigma subunit)